MCQQALIKTAVQKFSITLNAECEQTGGNVVQSPSLTFLATDAANISDIENREGVLQIITA